MTLKKEYIYFEENLKRYVTNSVNCSHEEGFLLYVTLQYTRVTLPKGNLQYLTVLHTCVFATLTHKLSDEHTFIYTKEKLQ